MRADTTMEPHVLCDVQPVKLDGPRRWRQDHILEEKRVQRNYSMFV